MNRLSLRRRIYDRGLRALLVLSGIVTCALLVFLIGYVLVRGVGGITWELLTTQRSLLRGTDGILPNILNTLYLILFSMVIVLPVGVGAAIYLTEYAENHRVVAAIEFAAETLTGIPSIIFGLVGMLFFVQLLGFGYGILAGGLTMVVMILPTIIRTTQESLRTVPQSYREGALGLGAGKWHMVRTVVTCALLVFLIGYVLVRGVGGITWELLTTQRSLLRGTDGILPNILNTLYLILFSMVIVLPVGVGAAIYLTEYAENHRVVAAIEFAAETLTGIPSIIFGLVGMLFFVQLLGFGYGILAGGLTMVVMILPTIIRTTQESLRTVPQSYREGALGLGAGKWHMVRTVVLPNAVDGIVTGCILAVGRIVGESAALLFTAGMVGVIRDFGEALHTSSGTLSVALYVYVNEYANTRIALAIAAILLLLTLVINLSASLVGRKLKKNI